jgi:predicted aminopeptidase
MENTMTNATMALAKPAEKGADIDVLRAEGWDANGYGVPDYSTLGWSNCIGGDPLLNTFVNGSEG